MLFYNSAPAQAMQVGCKLRVTHQGEHGYDIAMCSQTTHQRAEPDRECSLMSTTALFMLYLSPAPTLCEQPLSV